MTRKLDQPIGPRQRTLHSFWSGVHLVGDVSPAVADIDMGGGTGCERPVVSDGSSVLSSSGWGGAAVGCDRLEQNLTIDNLQTSSILRHGDIDSSVRERSEEIRDPILTARQREVLDAVVAGRSVFYTGSAGTGKSYLLGEIITALRLSRHGGLSAVAVTASTGSAACNLGGITLHSFAGIGIAGGSVDVLVQKVRRNAKAVSRWRRVKALVIDEVSMIDAGLFDKLEKLARILRMSDEPFGGIQVVATGDFLQLPPVGGHGVVKFAFEAASWHRTFSSSFVLSEVFRQRDEVFANMLHEVRVGIMSESTIARFRALARPLQFSQGPEPTELFPRRHEVEAANVYHLNKLTTPIREFLSVDAGAIKDVLYRRRLLDSFIVPQRLYLRTGAQVMLVKNTDPVLVNGSVGRIAGFVDGRVQIVRKGSVMIDELAPASSENVVPTSDLCPLVTFQLPSGRSRDVVVRPFLFTVALPTGEIQVSRFQLPLILAWAVSIHKAQGKTLARVKVDLKRVFESGQAYVALSRAMSMDGLQVLNFDPRKINVNSKAVSWSRKAQQSTSVLQK